MKKTLLTILLAFIAMGTFAQIESQKPFRALEKGKAAKNSNYTRGPLSEDFESSFPATGWSLTAGSGSWAQSSEVDHTDGTGNSAIYDCYNINGTNPAYLKTPEMVVTAGDATFSFWCNYYLVGGTYGDTDELYVDISTDGGATWTPGTTNYLATIAKTTWTQFTIDLTANIGSRVMLRFKAISIYGSYRIAIDDVVGPTVFEPAHDLGITSIYPSGFIVVGSTKKPEVYIKNYGSNSEATYSVTITDGVNYSETMNSSEPLATASYKSFIFPPWTPARGNYTLTATVTVANDEVAINNTLTKEAQVRPNEFGDLVAGFETYTGGAVGVETDGKNIYVQHFNSGVFERFDMSGQYMNSFTLSNAASIKDLAFDGTYFYGSPNTTSIYKLNLTQGAEALVSTITAPQACRALAYDAVDNTLWGNSGSGEMKEFKMTGELTGRSFTPSVSIYGAAYDYYTDPANPTIWGSDWSGGLARLVEWKLDGTETGRTVDLTSQFDDDVTVNAGGLAIFKEGNKVYLLADFQASPFCWVTKILLRRYPETTTDILTFRLNSLSPAVTGTVDATNHTVNLTVPFGTDVSALVPAITLSDGATISPLTGVAANFTSPVTYTVTAEDGTTIQPWTVTVHSAAPPTSTVTFSVINANGSLAATVDSAPITSPAAVVNGKDVVFTATPATNYIVKEWKLNNSVVAGNTTNTYTLSNVTASSTVTVEFRTTVGVLDIQQNGATIYPNPSNNLVKVKAGAQINKVTILDLNGKTVLEYSLNANEGTLDTSTLVNGFYFLRIETLSGIITEKMQVVK